MKSKGLLVLTALLGTGLVLGSCGGTTTSSSENVETSSSSESQPSTSEGSESSSEATSAYTATRVTISSKTPDKAVVGETIDFGQYITVAAPENGTFGLRVREGSTGAAVIDGHNVTITKAGSIGIQVVGANDANLRLWTVTALAAESKEMADYLTGLSYNYTVDWRDGTGNMLYGLTYHNENYWLALSDIKNSADQTSSTWSYWGAIQAGDYRYEIDFYENYDYVGQKVTYDYKAHPGIFDDSLYYAAAEMAFNDDTISTDPETGLTLITDAGVSSLIQTGVGTNYEAIKENVLDPDGYKQAFLTPLYASEEDTQIYGVRIIFADASYKAISTCQIYAAGETHFEPLDEFVEAGVAPSYVTFDDLGDYLGGKTAEKASTTIEAAISYGTYVTNSETGETTWKDASISGVSDMESRLGISSSAPAGTYVATVDGDSYYSTTTLSSLYYQNTDPTYMAIGKDTDGHYYRMSGGDPAAWKTKSDLGADFVLWDADGITTVYDEEYNLTGTEYLTPAALTTEYLKSLPYTSVTTSGTVTTATVDAIEDEGKLISIIAGLIPEVGTYVVAGVLNGITGSSGAPCYTLFESPSVSYDTATGDVSFEAVLANLAEDTTLNALVGLRLQVTLKNFGTTEVPAFGFTVAETTEGGAAN